MEPQQPEPLELSAGCVLAAVLALILLLAGLFFAIPVSPPGHGLYDDELPNPDHPRPEQLMVPPVKEEPAQEDAEDEETTSPFDDPLCRPLLSPYRFTR